LLLESTRVSYDSIPSYYWHTSFKLSTRADLANSRKIPTSSPLSVGIGIVDSESPEVEGAGGGKLACSLEGPAAAIFAFVMISR
jgi:hypothetical protein